MDDLKSFFMVMDGPAKDDERKERRVRVCLGLAEWYVPGNNVDARWRTSDSVRGQGGKERRKVFIGRKSRLMTGGQCCVMSSRPAQT